MIARAKSKGEQETDEQDAEDAAMKTADRATQPAAAHGLSKQQKKKAGPMAHLIHGAGFGALSGGATSRLEPAAADSGPILRLSEAESRR